MASSNYSGQPSQGNMAKDSQNPGMSHHDSTKSNNRHSKKHHTTTTTIPAVPPAHPRLLQSAQHSLTPVPTIDLEMMPATQGLNEWGAFTGGGICSDYLGTFGLGPLLLRHGRVDDEAGTGRTTGTTPRSLTGRDLVEMERLLRNDPVSFNPMQAISWARLDENVVKAPLPQRDKESIEKGEGPGGSLRGSGGSGGGAEYRQSVSSATASGKACQSAGDDRAAYRTTSNRGISLSTSTPKDVDQRYSGSQGPTASVVGSVDRSASSMDVAGSNECGVSVPPVIVSALDTTRQVDSFDPQVHQQRKRYHRREKRTGPSPVDTYTQQASTYQPSPLPIPSPLSSVPAQPLPSRVAYTVYSTNSTSAQSFHPSTSPPVQDTGLLVRFAPSFQAQFPSEAQLNSHYLSGHAAGHNDYDGRPRPCPAGFACSWTLCGASGFTSTNALVWHVKAEHLLLCPVPGCCNRVFPSWKQVDAHIKNRDA
ncbi:hypothetical protein N0V93_008128 [Gnomoniopsis smithogilvyi]|uniref:C2H2-type domain-containing protein n=1 Tax=Gnomoniopsis smithogilvyi TaxID=1191159 RepID=A0A9W8YNJ1_9PEZI|nr:hypothetical protein N0V93_008128 [Gnomoniopsis smithogilvyi]